MWQVLHSALHSDPESVLPSHESQECRLANRFVTFFSDKITKIRAFYSTDSFRLPTLDIPKFDIFKTVSDEDIHKTMKSPTKPCLLDPWPTF